MLCSQNFQIPTHNYATGSKGLILLGWNNRMCFKVVLKHHDIQKFHHLFHPTSNLKLRWKKNIICCFTQSAWRRTSDVANDQRLHSRKSTSLNLERQAPVWWLVRSDLNLVHILWYIQHAWIIWIDAMVGKTMVIWKCKIYKVFLSYLHWPFVKIPLYWYIARTHEVVLQICTHKETMQTCMSKTLLFDTIFLVTWVTMGYCKSWCIKNDQNVTCIQRTNISLPHTCQWLPHMMQTCILREGTQILLTLQPVVKAHQINNDDSIGQTGP